jgi:hypothetical protein
MPFACVFMTTVPITKLFACVWGETMEDMYYEGLPTQQWLFLAPDRPCDQHVQSTRRMSLTAKRPSTKGLPVLLE